MVPLYALLFFATADHRSSKVPKSFVMLAWSQACRRFVRKPSNLKLCGFTSAIVKMLLSRAHNQIWYLCLCNWNFRGECNEIWSIENCMRRGSAKTSDLILIASEFSHVHGAFGMSRTSVSSKLQTIANQMDQNQKLGTSSERARILLISLNIEWLPGFLAIPKKNPHYPVYILALLFLRSWPSSSTINMSLMNCWTSCCHLY